MSAADPADGGQSAALEWAAQFCTSASVESARRFGSGHVNDTFLVTDAAGAEYVLQRVGPPEFKRPEQVMANILRVTGAMAGADPRRHLTLVPMRDGGWWATSDAGDCWRMYEFIAGSCELSAPLSPDEFATVGRAFGDFLVQVAAVPPEDLFVTIPGYHDWPAYVERLKSVVAKDPCGRVSSVRADIERVLAYEEAAHSLDDAGLPLRVTHNDAKVANVLFDADTHEPLCVIDLDTVQPGWSVNDFGDMVRSGAATAPEDDPDIGRVHLSMELYEACLRGYLDACGHILQPPEIAHMRDGARLMTLETSLRFLTDYIEGDVYYHIAYPGQNLDRARNQATLLADIDRHWDKMGAALQSVAGSGPRRATPVDARTIN